MRIESIGATLHRQLREADCHVRLDFVGECAQWVFYCRVQECICRRDVSQAVADRLSENACNADMRHRLRWMLPMIESGINRNVSNKNVLRSIFRNGVIMNEGHVRGEHGEQTETGKTFGLYGNVGIRLMKFRDDIANDGFLETKHRIVIVQLT